MRDRRLRHRRHWANGKDALFSPLVILKGRDRKDGDVARLEALARRGDCALPLEKAIRRQITLLRFAALGETAVEQVMRRAWGDDPEWLVAHQLSLPLEEGVVEIDHLLISRLLDIWVCRAVRCPEGVIVSSTGQFMVRRGSGVQPMDMPFDGLADEVLAVKELFRRRLVTVPCMYGRAIAPRVHALVLVSSPTPMEVLGRDFPGDDMVIADEDLPAHVFEHQSRLTITNLVRLMSPPLFQRLGEELLALHQPAAVDWVVRFGLPDPEPPEERAPNLPPWQPLLALHRMEAADEVVQEPAEVVMLPAGDSYCPSCGGVIQRRDRLRLAASRIRLGNEVPCLACQQMLQRGYG